MIQTIKHHIKRNLVNVLGIRTKRKLIIFESDDWGSIRTPSKEAYNHLLRKGFISEDDPFARYDSLASEEDLSHLFDCLSEIKDFKGNYPVITANTIVANPVFEKIKSSGFRDYHYEPFPETLKRYPDHKNSFALWKQGMSSKVFFPQYHGREHVNVVFWLENLKSRAEKYLTGFENQTYAIDHQIAAAFDYLTEEGRKKAQSIVSEGYMLFNNIFGYQSQSFIAPNNTWDDAIEETLKKQGVKYIKCSKRQNVPNFIKKERVYHFTGQKNRLDQIYLVRNCLFEPSISPKTDYVSVCLRQISSAFFWRKPAIISSHRLNYIGYLDRKNRIGNLSKLKDLLGKILKLWPDAEFVNSDELGNIVRNPLS